MVFGKGGGEREDDRWWAIMLGGSEIDGRDERDKREKKSDEE
jgi:hypothetical protein